MHGWWKIFEARRCNAVRMNPRKLFLLLGGVILIAAGVYGMRLLWRGFSTADQPSFLETAVARTAGNLSISRNRQIPG
jgi:hypothetical protein